jgi:hypothetical protein
VTILLGRPRKHDATCPHHLNGEQHGALLLDGKRWRHGAAPDSNAKVGGVRHPR